MMHRTALLLGVLLGITPAAVAGPGQATPAATRVELDSEGWKLVGDLLVPESRDPVPAVLLLNKAAGDRTVYETLAHRLASQGVASLRLDLRGHGESVNRGRFVPSEEGRQLIARSDVDVTQAIHYLLTLPALDRRRIAVVGASYSGEKALEAARQSAYVQAYAMLSPGSLSDESILGLDAAGVPWLYVASRTDRYLQEVTAAVLQTSGSAEIVLIPGTAHATSILESRPDVAERMASWLAATLTHE